MPTCDLEVKIGKMTLKNPVIVSSGTFGFGEEFKDFIDLNHLGAIIPKGISLTPMMGNPPPRIFRQRGESSIPLDFRTLVFWGLLKIKCPIIEI